MKNGNNVIKDKCDGCEHKEEKDDITINKKCKVCARYYPDMYEPIPLEEGLCKCVSCGMVYKLDGGRIFRLKSNPQLGLCFDCY